MRRARCAGAVLLLVAAASALTPGKARASEVSGAELRSLARQAVDDPSALARLRGVDAVDGQPVDIGAALRGARGMELQERLVQLAERSTVAVPARGARAEAREVLAEDRFRESSVPGPFRRVLDWIGERLPDVSVDWLHELLPGGRWIDWLVLAALLTVAAAVVSRRFLTRRVRASSAAARLAAAARDEDPRSLERRAEAAETAGDLEAALRLRFRAGLLRLDARGAIDFRPSISTYEVRRTLHSDDFDALAATFDDVVYGGREADESDLASAREHWPRVLETSSRGTVPFEER